MASRLLALAVIVLLLIGCEKLKGPGEPPPKVDTNSIVDWHQKNVKKKKVDSADYVLPLRRANKKLDIPRGRGQDTTVSQSNMSSADSPSTMFHKAVLTADFRLVAPSGGSMPLFTDVGVSSLIDTIGRMGPSHWGLITGDITNRFNAFFMSASRSGVDCSTGPYNGVLFLPDPDYPTDPAIEWGVTNNQRIMWKLTPGTVRTAFLTALAGYVTDLGSNPTRRFAMDGLWFGDGSCTPITSVVVSINTGENTYIVTLMH